MDRTEIIRLAKEAFGVEFISESDGGKLERFAQLVAAEYKQDALRYRWLKEYCTTESYDGDLGLKFRCDFENWNHIDAAIDAAMEKVK